MRISRGNSTPLQQVQDAPLAASTSELITEVESLVDRVAALHLLMTEAFEVKTAPAEFLETVRGDREGG
jgi:hypothetical protein